MKFIELLKDLFYEMDYKSAEPDVVIRIGDSYYKALFVTAQPVDDPCPNYRIVIETELLAETPKE